jgi:hypothetical protein
MQGMPPGMIHRYGVLDDVDDDDDDDDDDDGGDGSSGSTGSGEFSMAMGTPCGAAATDAVAAYSADALTTGMSGLELGDGDSGRSAEAGINGGRTAGDGACGGRPTSSSDMTNWSLMAHPGAAAPAPAAPLMRAQM